MRTIDLSCDLGEAQDEAQQRIEDQIWPLITSANVACGAHAGDHRTMRHAVEQAERYRVRLGAHPSYPDREHFGRKSMRLPAPDLKKSLIEQIEDLSSIAGVLTHVKPHGALYNDAHHDAALAQIIVEAVAEYDRDLALVCSADSELFGAAGKTGLARIAEAFGDRRYESDGSLVSRSRPDALLLDFEEAAAQAASLVQSGMVTAADGRKIAVRFDSICIHGDMPGAVDRLKRIRAQIAAAGLRFAPKRAQTI